MAKKPSNNRPSPAPSRPSSGSSKPSSSKPSSSGSSKPSSSNNKPSNNKPQAAKPNNPVATSRPQAGTSAPTPSRGPGGPIGAAIGAGAQMFNSIAQNDAIRQQYGYDKKAFKSDKGNTRNQQQTADQTINQEVTTDAAEAATEAQLRNPNRDKNHWTNADYGNKFGMQDIKGWMEKSRKEGGYNANQIMKIAQAAYAGGDVKNVNKLNKKLGALNQEWINPEQVTGSVKGQQTTWSRYPIWDQKAPKKAFEWNGFGNGMTQYDREGIPGLYGGSYKKGQQWSLPTNFMNGFSPIPTADPGPSLDPGDGGDPGDGTPDDLTPEVPEKESNPSMNQGGYGDDTTNWATSWRGKKSTRGGAGRRGQGTGSMINRGPATKAQGVGVRF